MRKACLLQPRHRVADRSVDGVLRLPRPGPEEQHLLPLDAHCARVFRPVAPLRVPRQPRVDGGERAHAARERARVQARVEGDGEREQLRRRVLGARKVVVARAAQVVRGHLGDDLKAVGQRRFESSERQGRSAPIRP
eukprot:2163128-Pleurochrysis_carterae.AAC.1